MALVLENLTLLDMADDLTEMIINSDLFQNYIGKKQMVNNHSETQQRIREFTKIKERYEDVERFGKYHPDYKEVTRNIRRLKRELDMDERVALFRRAEMDLQSLLDEISLMLASSVSENIKVPTGNPFFEQKSTCSSGGCGTGGSCGCSS